MRTIISISILSALVLFSCQKDQSALLRPVKLTCEYLVNPPVIDVAHPRLSWINSARPGVRGQYQSAYQVQVATSQQLLKDDQPDVWDSQKVNSDQSFLVAYGGADLKSATTYWWRVRVWNRQDKTSKWSEPGSWNMGILKEAEWKAKWIGAPWQGEDPLPDPVLPELSFNEQDVEPKPIMPPPAPMFRKEFKLSKEISEAKAFVTGLGYFEFYVNGKKVSEDVLVPNQTNFGKRPGLENDRVPIENNFREYRVMYLCYDITDMLVQGENTLGAILGNGFYNAPITWTASYGSPRFIGQVYIKYADGTEDLIISDESWKASKSPIVSDLVYEGEHYDARLEQTGWNTAGFDDSAWEQAVLRIPPDGKMKAHMAKTDRVMERLAPVAIRKIGDGHYIADFGQEISGWLNISGISGQAGQRIDIKYVSNDSVSVTSGSNSYTLKGVGPESYAARFTWFVFRYAELTNWPGDLDASQLKAEAVYTNVETTGKFETSNLLFNKINQIWWRSQTDNMHGGIASDCPNRERSPYTGDGQVACVTVMHNFDAKAFYNKWIQDILGAQNPETGYVPNGAPWQPGCGGGPAWGAAMNIMPWEFYQQYGDRDMLANTYEGMKGYVRYMLTWTDKNGIMYSQRLGSDGQVFRWLNLGDWAQPFELPPDDMVHTFYLWRCADFTSKAAKALGNDADAAEYAAIAERTRKAFHVKFYDAAKGTYGPNGGNIFALVMGVPEDQKQLVTAALKADIAARDGHLDTGIFGTQFFFEVLADYGMQDLAYEAMNKTTQPSFGWWVENGNTTSWEGWSRPGSGNHPMFGGGLVWFYRKLAGMNTDPENPGYKKIIFRPQPAADMTYAKYSNLTPYGEAGIRWEKEDKSFLMVVTVPVGSTATVYVPAEDISKVSESGKKITQETRDVTFLRAEDGYAVFEVQSGTYNFRSE
jgi:alpha-L-rhamnosidase